jgi:hypothetical protein
VLADPLLAGPWTAPPATNLALTKNSPAIGAGIPLAAVTHDFLGAPRPSAAPDIGAFEYGATAPEDAGFVTAGDGSVAALNDGAPGPTDESDGGAGAASGAGGSSGGVREGGAPDSSNAAAKGSASSGCSCSEATPRAGGGGFAGGVAFVFAAACARMRARGRTVIPAVRGEPRSRA